MTYGREKMSCSYLRKRVKKKTIRVLKTPKTDSSVTYKLKLNGGDIKAVQGDSGHAQVSMVTDVDSHILDNDRKKNAELFEEAFYEKSNLDPQMHPNTAENTVAVPEGVDAELLQRSFPIRKWQHHSHHWRRQ